MYIPLSRAHFRIAPLWGVSPTLANTSLKYNFNRIFDFRENEYKKLVNFKYVSF